MKKLIISALALAMLFSLSACGAKVNDDRPKATEPAAVEATEPAETEPAEATEVPEFITGGRDYCQKIELDETYYYDIDGDGLCDKVELGQSTQLIGGSPVLTVTFGADPDHPAFWAALDESTIWVIDSDPDEAGLEILETDDGGSDDYSSVLLVANPGGRGLMEYHSGYGARIDEAHPFSSEEGFSMIAWTDLMGTSTLTGRVRPVRGENGWTFECVGDGFVYDEYAASQEYAIKTSIEAELVNDDGSAGDMLTLSEGDTVSPAYTDNETFIVFRLADGRLVRAAVERPHDWELFIGGVLQDELFDVSYSG